MKSSSLFSRRNFIKSSLLAGAAPLILPSGIWAADAPPSQQITLGFIGLGAQGSGLLGGFLPRDDVRVLAVCDVDTKRRTIAKNRVLEQYAKDTASGTYKGCDDYSNFEDLLARKDIDGVVIATPNQWHAFLVIAAAKAGKDIYIEKPMNYTVREGRAMVKAVRKHHRILQVGSMQRSMGEFRTACELVRNGVLGTVAKADVAIGGPGRPCDLPEEPAEPGLDWDRWLGCAPYRPYNSILSPRGMPNGFPQWRRYTEYGGGDVYDWGAHHFDIVQWAFGYDDSGPIEIIPAEQPNAQSGVRLRYDNGLEVTHVPGNGVTFYGDKGKMYVNRGKFQLWIGNEQKANDVDDCPKIIKEMLPANATRLYRSTNHLSDWLNSMRTRKLPICDVETGNRTGTICGLVDLAYYHNQTLKWNPKTEHFGDGTGDSKWLTREYRHPWKVS